MGHLEPLIGAIGAFFLGFAWYTALFGKAWQRESGVTDEQAKEGIGLTHGLAFLMMVVISYALNIIIGSHELTEQTFSHGGLHGVMAAVFFCVPAIAINYLYQKKSLKLFLIDAGYTILWCTLSGAIMGALKLG